MIPIIIITYMRTSNNVSFGANEFKWFLSLILINSSKTNNKGEEGDFILFFIF